jgi:cytoskeletal protein CcmA (bactofilin family)
MRPAANDRGETMFNKPTLFPKTPEPQIARSGRIGTAALSTGAAAAPVDNAAVRESGSSAGAPAGGSAAAPSRAQSESRTEAHTGVEGGSSLIVGPQVKLKGAEILDCDTLVVEGRVEATMDSRVIRIAQGGAFAGTVCIDVAEIDGRFDGELTARSQLIIRATGRVSGTIRYGRIFIEEGGEISGDVKALEPGSGQGARAEPVSGAAARATLSPGSGAAA